MGQLLQSHLLVCRTMVVHKCSVVASQMFAFVALAMRVDGGIERFSRAVKCVVHREHGMRCIARKHLRLVPKIVKTLIHNNAVERHCSGFEGTSGAFKEDLRHEAHGGHVRSYLTQIPKSARKQSGAAVRLARQVVIAAWMNWTHAARIVVGQLHLEGKLLHVAGKRTQSNGKKSAKKQKHDCLAGADERRGHQ